MKRVKRVYLLDLKSKTYQRPAISIYHDNCGKKLSFAEVVSKFLGHSKNSDYQSIVENTFACFETLGCRTSLKVHFLHAHLDYFSQNLCEEYGERFHQGIKITETWYQG